MARTKPLRKVAALFVRTDSIYKTLPGVDAWDKERDARGYVGSAPVVMHPPCAQWGQLAHFAHDKPEEKALALFAVDTVRRCGGVLEHPKASKLWEAKNMSRTGAVDDWGGWTLPVLQFWWGHLAEKATLLYVVGITAGDIPPIQLRLGVAERAIGSRNNKKPELLKSHRDKTPPAFAAWLVDLARRCHL
jgi:hypothetical protein